MVVSSHSQKLYGPVFFRSLNTNTEEASYIKLIDAVVKDNVTRVCDLHEQKLRINEQGFATATTTYEKL